MKRMVYSQFEAQGSLTVAGSPGLGLIKCPNTAAGVKGANIQTSHCQVK